MNRQEIKREIIKEWVKNGLSKEDILNNIEKSAQLLQGASDVLFKYVPIASFGIPLVAGAVLFHLNHPSYAKEKAYKKVKDVIKENIRKAKGITI